MHFYRVITCCVTLRLIVNHMHRKYHNVLPLFISYRHRLPACELANLSVFDFIKIPTVVDRNCVLEVMILKMNQSVTLLDRIVLKDGT